MTVQQIDETTDQGWTVHAEVEGQHLDQVPDDALDAFVDLMNELGGAVSSSADSYGATWSLRSDRELTAIEAATTGAMQFRALAAKAGLPELPIVDLNVQTFTVHDRELDRSTMPELVSVSEIADILAVSRQRAHQLTKRNDFPEPIARLSAGPIWTRPSLNLFVERWRDDKPDVDAELAAIDDALAKIRNVRNQIVHGTTTTESAMAAALTSTQAVAMVFGTLGMKPPTAEIMVGISDDAALAPLDF